MRVLLLGTSGFIGRELFSFLATRGQVAAVRDAYPLGWPAFAALLLVLWLMVARPD